MTAILTEFNRNISWRNLVKLNVLNLPLQCTEDFFARERANDLNFCCSEMKNWTSQMETFIFVTNHMMNSLLWIILMEARRGWKITKIISTNKFSQESNSNLLKI